MNIDIIKNKNKINVYEDNKPIKNKYCFIIGKINNIEKLDNSKISPEEKILKLFKKYKERLFDMLEGIFSLIIINDEKIYAITDKIGTHHIYYMNNNKQLIISTNLNYIIKSLDKPEINKQALANYLCHTYIKSPDTILKNVYKLSPGTYIKSVNEKIECKKYYDIKQFYKNNRNTIKNKDEAIDLIEKDIIDTITKNIEEKDKNIGIFFSAGVDSTLITALTKKCVNKNINTYTIGFEDENIDETKRALNIAKHLNTIHHKEYITKQKVIEIIHNYPNIYPEPIADSSFIPTIFLHEITKNDKIDKILTGDGADQFFSGYYGDLGIDFKYPIRYMKYKLLKIPVKEAKIDPYNVKKYLVEKIVNIKSIRYYDMDDAAGNKHEKCMQYDINSFLADRLMTKVMYPVDYYNKNMIFPFLDEKTFKDAIKLDFNIKWHDKKNKFILREINSKYIPKDFLNPIKNGFGAPVKNWTYMLKDEIKFYLNTNIIKKQNLFNIDFVNKLLQKLDDKIIEVSETRMLFGIYLFEIWYQKNIKDLWIKTRV